MNITIVTSNGEGQTLLSAFDNALQNSGVHNYNLLRLSSIIPPHSKIIKKSSYDTDPAEFGHKLYVVMAEMRSSQAGKHLAAGIGWYQLGDEGGFFVEHETIGDTRVAVQSEIAFLINSSLRDMCNFRGIAFDENNVKLVVSTVKVTNKPACALAIAVYQSEGWR